MIIARRRLIFSASLAGLAAAVTRGSAADLQTVKVGTQLSSATVACQEIGPILARHGVKLEIVSFPDITQRMQAVAAGDLQIGYGGISAAILMAVNNVKLTVLSNVCEGGWNMVAKPGITTWDQLRGKSVGSQLGTPADLVLRWKAKKLGLLDSINILNMTSINMATAFVRGDLDAIMAFEPYASFAQLNGGAKPFWLPYDTPIGRTNNALVASPAFVAANRSLMKTLVQAHVEATANLQKDNSEALQAVIRVMNMPLPVAELSLKNTFYSSKSGTAFHKGIQALGQMMLEGGLVKTLPDWSSFIDTSMVV